MTIVYQQPYSPPVGAVLGRSVLRVFDDNDRFFKGYLSRMQTIPTYAESGFWLQNTARTVTVLRGWHYLNADCTTVHYWMQATGCEGTARVRFYYNDTLIAERAGTGLRTGSFAPHLEYNKLYFWEYTLERGNTDDAGSAAAIPPWSVFDANNQYSNASGSWVDGETADPSDFDKLVFNDRHFYRQIGPQTPTVVADGVFDSVLRTGKTQTIWAGMVVYTSWQKRIWYKMRGHKDDNRGDVYLELLWNDTVTLVSQNLTSTMTELEGHIDITGTYTENALTVVRVQLRRTQTGESAAGGYGNCEHIFYGSSGAASITDPGTRTVGSVVYGQGGGNSALEKLALNDAAIYDRLVRRDYGTPYLEALLPNWMTGEYLYCFMRLGDFLYYRGRGVKLWYAYGNRSVALRDTEDEDYLIMDLNQIPGLHYGMVYSLQSSALEFAMEC